MISINNASRYLKKSVVYLNACFVRTGSNYQVKSNKKSLNYNQKLEPSIKSTQVVSNNSKPEFIRFEDEISFRRKQASNSLLFKIENEFDLFNLTEDLEKIGCKISKILVLDEFNNTNSRAVLVEFSSKIHIDNVFNNYGIHFSNADHLPSKTRLFVYRNLKQKNNQKSLRHKFNIEKYTLSEKDQINSSKISLNEKFSFLKSSQTLDYQIRSIYEKFKLDEIGIRIRFFIASLIEESFYSLFRNCLCLPFGSSAVNFGHKNSDLDLLFSLENTFFNTGLDKKKQQRLNGKIIFYSKLKKNEQDRDTAKKYLELSKLILSDIIPKFNVRQLIKGARVPILEFDFELPSGQRLNCDLSMNSILVSYQMTKLFWTFTKTDHRIAPLIFFLKYWAKITGVTNIIRPSPNITNFQLTVLILNFLLRLDKPLIVPLENIITYVKDNSSDSELRFIVNENVNLAGIKEMITETNEITVNELLMGFFNFYSNFDFDSNIISLSRQLNYKTGQFMHEPLVIQNPFVPEMNASKNVNRKLLKRFKFFCNQSYEYLHAKDSIDMVKFIEFLRDKSKEYVNSNE